MLIPSHPASPEPGADLEHALASVEQRLSALAEALRASDPQAIDRHASELHRALAEAVHRFAHAARAGGVPPALRRRLAHASGEVAAHRESLARATAALDRAIDVLLPRDNGGVYSAHGAADRGARGGVIQA
jgi:hypothetical protein